MIKSIGQIAEIYISNLDGLFKNPNLPSEYAINGITKFLNDSINNFSNDIYNAFTSMINGASTNGISVNGGGGSPGMWSGGVGTGGNLVFTFNLFLQDTFNASYFVSRNRKMENTISTIINDVLKSFTFTNLFFASGSSSHTNSNPGTLISSINSTNTLTNTGVFQNINELNNIAGNIQSQLGNFKITNNLTSELNTIQKVIINIFNYFSQNTNVIGVIASGGITTPSVGILS